MRTRRLVRPPTLREIRTLRALSVGLLIPFIGLPLVFSLCMLSTTEDVAGSLFCLIPGFLLGVTPFYVVRVLNNRRDVFLRSMRFVDARVVDRKKVKVKTGGSGAGGIGLILDIAVWIIERAKPSYIHILVLEFEATQELGGSTIISLEKPVSENKFETHPPGSIIRIRYAMENPYIMLLDEEYQSKFLDA